jgi:AraC-like DNA-binding protein
MKSELEKLGFHPISIDLGEIKLPREATPKELEAIALTIGPLGFELIDNKQQRIIEKIKSTVIGTIHGGEYDTRYKYSQILSEALNHDYTYLSKVFSEVEGITIEKYIIKQKIEKVKELLAYEELSLSEIAHRLGYSSSAHLSSQFKKVTGLPPSHFKNVGAQQRKSLDKLT